MSKNQDLLKEAIADAKILKATAIANAKAALEESFTPHLKSMFEEKINEMEDEEDEVILEEEETTEETTEETEEETTEETTEETEEDSEEVNVEDMTEEELKDFVEDVVKEMAEAGELETSEVPETDGEIDLDIEIGGEEGEDEEVDVDQLISELKRAKRMRTLKESKFRKPSMNGRKLNAPKRKPSTNVSIVENLKLKSELQQSNNVIKQLNEQLKEINLLNAKLLYSNKLFKSHTLNESQKIKVLDQFDKATTTKEVKLIFETLNANIQKSTRKPIKENLGFASKAMGQPKRKPITENKTNNEFSRWQKLAGL